jgi:hypothetical protein
MSLFEKPADIVARARAIVATSIFQLELPPPTEDPRPVQPTFLLVNDTFHVLSPDKRMYGVFVVTTTIFDQVT